MSPSVSSASFNPLTLLCAFDGQNETRSREVTQLREELAELKVDKSKLQDKCEVLQRKVVERCEEDEASRLYDQLEATRHELLEAKERKESAARLASLQ